MPRGGTLSSLGGSFEELIRASNGATEAVAELHSELTSVSQQTQRNAQQINSVIDALREGMAGIRTDIQALTQSFTQLNTATSQGRRSMQQEAATIDDLWAAYRKMGVEIKELTIDTQTLKFTQKEINKVVQLGNEYNDKRIDSYTALSQKYRAMKILIDQMTVSERENTEQGRALVAAARDMYEQMNVLQQQTGKYQLQVGNYSKAMTGLNIATQQVIRELPVLANGASMFAIAISNNIPILLDNVMAVKRSNEALIAHKKELEETAAAARAMGDAEKATALEMEANSIKTMSVMKGLAASLFSWQTAIVLLLTVIPGLIKNIERKRKAQEEEKKAQDELNKSLKEGESEMRSLDAIYRDIRSSIEGEVTELKVLQVILSQVNRSWEDRVDAGKRLKQIFDEELEGFNAEEIAMGKAAQQMQILTQEIYNQAKARATLNKVTELTQKMIELEGDADIYANWQIGTRTIKEYLEEVEKANKEGRRVQLGAKEMEYVEKYRSILSQMNGYQNEINALIDQIKPSDLLEELTGGRGGKSSAFKIGDFYNEALGNIINNMSDAFQKEMALLELEWKKQRESYEGHRQELLKIQREGNAQERQEATTQLSNLNLALVALEEQYVAERKRLFQELLDSYKSEVKDEGDVEEAQMKRIEIALKAEQRLRETAAYEEYERGLRALEAKEDNALSEAQLKENLNQALAKSEKEYWEGYLAQLREAGILTVREYNNIMANLAKASKDGEGLMSRGRKGRKYGGLFEAILAQTKTYGEGNKFGQGILKEEYANFVTSLDEALKTSMGYMDEWMDKRLEMAQVAVDAAQKEVEATKKYLDYELETRANGYANRVETARKEVELARKTHKEALAEQKRLQDQQLALDAISQTSSLITATANIWEAMTKGTGVLGPALATAATVMLWGSFAASKVKAAQLAGLKAEQYGEGTVQLLRGGSHASGNDIDLGHKSDGTPRRAEGGEFLAIINKRNSKKYRGVIPDVINSLNNGTFGERYQRANAMMGDYALSVMGGTDVSALERDVAAIKTQGQEARYVDGQGNTIVRYKNLTRKIKS